MARRGAEEIGWTNISIKRQNEFLGEACAAARAQSL